MRAVNLIPSDQRGGASVGAGRSEGAAYAVLALLVAVALMALLYGKASREISSNRSKAATVTAEAQRAQAEASTLAPYSSFIALREQREQAVAALVDTRFDWAHAFHEFGRVLTNQVSISSLDGTVGSATTSAPSSAAGPSTPSSTVTSATPAGSVPTFTIAGCATSQRVVADTMQRLRLIDGVAEVDLHSSTRGAAGSAGTAGGCAGTDAAFQMTVTFEPLPSAAASAAAAGAKSKTVASTPSSPAVAPAAGSSGGAAQ